ncbi:MAG TPA: glucosamine-6-phosphate deaminase [Bacillota bacterium]|nr:glucosamine-6-phosphate deaminase [Bacillota bacterium]HOK68403.1 glucosamine-6-phosphate deaminase [Bacillota bacterium]HPP85158.1 glucosamine-6-phosphate deaminase [Bacillota bacterium]
MSLIKTGKQDLLTYKIYQTRDEMGKAAAAEAAEAIKKLLETKGEINMIFAAAPSQNEFLAALTADKSIDFTKINAFHMDEYIGLPADAPQRFANFLKRSLFDKVPFKSVNIIDCTAPDPEKECERYAALLKEYPCDIVCMGIGENGHIAFNDPHDADFDDPKTVKVVSLDEVCRQQQVNDGCFRSIDEVPKYALSLTIPALIAPEYVFCVVPAKTKADAVKNTLTGPIDESCPASILRRHKNAVLYLDMDSAALVL